VSRRGFLLAAAVVVLVANGSALYRAAGNRSGSPDSEVTLSERELSIVRPTDQSGLFLRLNWARPGRERQSTGPGSEAAGDWLDTARLGALGFDCSVPPSSPDAAEHYERQPSIAAFVALKLDADGEGGDPLKSRLVGLDASRDASDLRRRFPDRQAVIVLPANVAVRLVRPAHRQGDSEGAAGTSRLTAWVSDFPRQIQVPRPYSDQLRRVSASNPRFQVRLRFGALHEPWVAGVSVP
jgi:hypothetical protein